MRRSEKRLLDAIRSGSVENAEFFSRAGKPLQERTVVHGFLRVVGIEHVDGDIIKRGPEPIDVWFADARFQVTEIMDPNRPRDREMRQQAERVKAARSLDDLWESGTITSKPIQPDAALELVVERAKEKAVHYAGDCSGIDLLVYVNLRGRHLYPTSPFNPAPELRAQKWRSVSLVMERFGIVLLANSSAPKFLHDSVGKSIEWGGIDSIFAWA
jgi:hypothetical protein